MKKLSSIKKLFSMAAVFVVAIFCAITFCACKPPVSSTSADMSKVFAGTNGGVTAIYDGYLYFINGTKNNDGSSLSSNKKSAICRVKINSETGEIDDKSYEVVVGDLVGYKNGSIYIFGDYLYYATPSSGKNKLGTVMYNKTKFMRYDLVNKQSYEIYTSELNDSAEELDYTYYISGGTVNLVVYEKNNKTITSIKVNTSCSTNFVIKNVESVVLSQNFGQSETQGADVDANSYIFYTKQSGILTQSGNPAVYMIMPTASGEKDAVCLADEGKQISIQTIKNGKLIFSEDTIIYVTKIDATTRTLQNAMPISYISVDNIIYVEIGENDATILYCNDDGEIFLIEWKEGQIVDLENAQRHVIDKPGDDFTFIGLVTVEEEYPLDDSKTGTEGAPAGEEHGSSGSPEEDDGGGSGGGKEPEEPKTYTQNVVYLIYFSDSLVYKLEIKREVLNEDKSHKETPTYEYATSMSSIQLSKTKFEAPSGKLIPEVIGNYLYIFAKDLDDDEKQTDNIYMFRVDLRGEGNKDKYASFVGIKE